MEKMFEYAAKNKLRFPYKGWIATEDLFDLGTNALSTIHKALYAENKSHDDEGNLINSSAITKDQEDLQVKMAIVKYVFDKKMAEIADRQDKLERKEKLQYIYDIIESKKKEELLGLSVEELEKRAAELQG